MKCLTVLTLVCMTVAARAASPTDAYLAARDRAIASLQRGENQPDPDPDGKYEAHALAGLEPMIRDIIGPIGISGFPPRGSSHVDELSGGTDLGKLDGISARSITGKTEVIVTTEALLRAWLNGHRNWWNAATGNPPANVDEAFKSASFYQQAIANDAAVWPFAEIPVATRSTGSVAGALLFSFGQDFVSPNPPEEIAVSVMVNGRVFVLTEKTATKLNQIAVCKSAYDRERKAADNVLEAYRVSGAKDEAMFANYTKLEDGTDTHFRRCLGEHIKKGNDYTALVRQAQALVDLVSPR